MPLIASIVSLFVLVLSYIVRAFTLTRGLLLAFTKLVASYWPKILAAIPALIYLFIDHLEEKLADFAADAINNNLTPAVNEIPSIPFPDIPSLASAYYAIDPTILQWLQAFRVSESLAIIGSVVAWKMGQPLAMRVIGKFYT